MDALYKLVIDYLSSVESKNVSDNQKITVIKNILVALSGDYNSADSVAKDMILDMEHWSDVHVNVATAGSIIEPLDLTDHNISKFVGIQSAVKLTKNLTRLVRFIGFKHFLNLHILNPKVIGVSVISNDNTMHLIERFTLLGNKNTLYREVWNSIRQREVIAPFGTEDSKMLLDDNIIGSNLD